MSILHRALTLFLLSIACDRVATLSLGRQRRNVLLEVAILPLPFCRADSLPAAAADLLDDDEIRTTITGVQYRDDRIGQGPVVMGKDAVVMHLQGLTRDGSVIIDTRKNGRPILHQLGSVVNFDIFGGDSSQRPVVTLGIEDGIRGMRYGGVRRMVVPSPLGYGNAGVSRYDAMRMGLLKPVPRDELLRYEVELLRCIDVVPVDDAANGLTAQACCTEPSYPCKTNSSSE
jgi:FKBP-type peptidyl-prolyl cis-trans isomerase